MRERYVMRLLSATTLEGRTPADKMHSDIQDKRHYLISPCFAVVKCPGGAALLLTVGARSAGCRTVAGYDLSPLKPKVLRKPVI